jgi:tRNA(Ile)-lysidine synthase
VADRVELAFRREALALLPKESSAVVAVSGGSDSVALLHLLERMARGRPLTLTIAHLDHAMRRGSATDRKFVERLAASLEIDCLSDRRDVVKLRRKSESPEEAARRVRRAFLLESRRRARADVIATGHTLDDQAETVLMRLVRGAGPAALAGMSVSGPGPFVRPLLGIERAELRGYLDRQGLDYREDPSNRDLRFDRNRARRLALPALNDALNPRAARHLVKAAERLREDAAYLDDLALEACRRLCREGRGGRIEIPARKLASTPPPLARRIVREALARAGCDRRRITSRHIDAVLEIAAGGRGKHLDLPGGVTAARVTDRVVLRP